MAELENYNALVARVDELCQKIAREYDEHICCQPGCDSCCRHLSLFPVEAAALAAALRMKPAGEIARIRDAARTSLPDGHCPLLSAGICLLYEARPIICRTHGLPLLTTDSGNQQLDFCPKNFQGLRSLPGGAIIGLDQLNETLTAINALFVAGGTGPAPPPHGRLTIAEALLLETSHD